MESINPEKKIEKGQWIPLYGFYKAARARAQELPSLIDPATSAKDFTIKFIAGAYHIMCICVTTSGLYELIENFVK